MSKDRKTGRSPTRSFTVRAYPSGPSARSSSLGTTVNPSARASSRSDAAYSEPRIPACTDAPGSIRPSSAARLNVVPWKYRCS